MKKKIITITTTITIIIAGIISSLYFKSSAVKCLIEAPIEAQPGELVILEAKIAAASYTWKVIPDNENYKIIEDGKKLIFSSQYPGQYIFVLAAAKGDTVDMIVHTINIVVYEPEPEPAPIVEPAVDTFIELVKTWLPEDYEHNEPMLLSRSFELVALIGHDDIDKFLKVTALSNRTSLGEELDKWKPFLEKVSQYCKENLAEKDIDAHIEFWLELAKALRSL